MMNKFWLVALMGVAAAWAGAAAAAEAGAKGKPEDLTRRIVAGDLRVPGCMGVNIHFTDPKPGEMEMLAEGGFRWVRMDFSWSGTEREKGVYDFSAFERLLAALKPHGIRALFILDYRNKFYDDGDSPRTAEGRAAFARWAAAAVKHFHGQGILWEMYNEPNLKQFWRPKPNVDDYIALALETGKAIREAAPGEIYIGPATSRIDLEFIEPCLKAGLLEYWSAVSVHPYREKNPETAAEEYVKLQAMIKKYAPKGKRIPVLSGEWGYTVLATKSEEKQGQYLARQMLANLMCGVPLSIWYDWHDDGTDPKEREHHFGTVRYEYHEGREPVYDPKAAYQAARTLSRELGGFRYAERVDAGDPEVYVLAFVKGKEKRVAAWTTAAEPRTVTIPGFKGKFRVTGHTGEKYPGLEAGAGGVKIELTDGPVYLSRE